MDVFAAPVCSRISSLAKSQYRGEGESEISTGGESQESLLFVNVQCSQGAMFFKLQSASVYS